MDLGVAPHHSHHLVGFLPSTYPPPLGERNRQSGHTTSHSDSHMMGNRKDEILEMSSPPQEGKAGEDPSEHVTTFHLWCSSNSLHDDSIYLRLFQCTCYS